MKLLLLLLGISAAPLIGYSELIPPQQLTDWTPGTRTGVPGGIDQYLAGGAQARTLFDVTKPPYNADNTGTTNALNAIQTALNEKGSIYLPAGTYLIYGQIYIGHAYDGITIRGDGPGQTILKGATIYFGASDGWISPSSNGTPVTSGLSRDSQTITVADASAISVGNLLRLAFDDQVDNTALQGGAIVSFGVGGPQPGSGVRRQVTRVTGKSGNTLAISPGIYHNPEAGLSATAWNAILQNDSVGIEDLAIDMAGSSNPFGILMEHCNGCWVKNVKISNIANYCIAIQDSLQCEVRHCELRDRAVVGSNGAALLLNAVSGSLFEDNLILNVAPCLEVNAGSSGNVFAYNVMENASKNGAINFGIDSNHGPHNAFNLYEGNVSPNIISDGYFGSNSEDTIFRNWLHGTCAANDATTFTLSLKRFTRNCALVGNVLGKTMVSMGAVDYGRPNIGNALYVGTAQPTQGKFWNDWNATAVLTTRASDNSGTITLNSGSLFTGQFATLKWGGNVQGQNINTSSVNGNVVSWSNGSGGALPPEGSTVTVFMQANGYQELDLDVQASTVEKGNYMYGQAGASGGMSSLGADSLKKSLFRLTAPAWFGSLAWPPIDPTHPDVTAYDSIPAGYRFTHNGADPPGVTNRPPAPTNLRVVP